MPIKYIKATAPFFKFTMNVFLVMGTILLLLFAVFAIRMSMGPMDMDFAKERIEAALSDSDKGYEIEIGKLSLTWPQVIGAMLLDLKDVEIIQKDATRVSVGQVALGLSGLYLLQGKIRPSVVIIDGPSFELVQENGRYNFLSQKQTKKADTVDDLEADQGAEQGQNQDQDQDQEQGQSDPQSSSSLSVQEIKAQVLAFMEKIENPVDPIFLMFSDLKRFEVRNAVIIDEQNSDNPYLALINLTLKNHALGLYGDLRIIFPDEMEKNLEEQKAELQFDIIYRWIPKDLTFTATVKNIDPARFSDFFPDQPLLKDQKLHIDGLVKVDFNSDFNLDYLTLNLRVPEGELVLPELYEEPLSLKNVIFDAKFDREEKLLNISKAQANVGGIVIQASTKAHIDDAIKGGNILFPLEINISNAPMNKLSALVPKNSRTSSGGEWLYKYLKKGRVHDIKVVTDLILIRGSEELRKKQEILTENTKVDFKVENLTVEYSDTLMPVTDVIGAGHYEDDVLTITAEIGNIGDIVGRNVTVKLSDLSVIGGGDADIFVEASGPLSAVFKYIAAEPIAMSDELGFDVKNVKGNAKFTLQLSFPTVKDLLMDDVNVKINGQLFDLLIPDVVEGLPLTGGPYDFKFADGAMHLSGSGKLAERPITLSWMQYLDSTGHDFETKITAKIIADESLRKIFDIGLTDYISGPIPVDIVYFDKGKTEIIELKGDLTPTTLHIDPFDYHKAPAVKGILSFKAYIKDGEIEEIDQLTVGAKDLSLSGGRLLFKKMRQGKTDIHRGALPVVNIGKSKVAIDFEVTPKDELKIIAKGSVVDILPFIKIEKTQEEWNNPAKKEEQFPMIISLSADRLLAHKGEVITKSKIYLETNKTGDVTRIEMDASIGKGEMYLRFKPDSETGMRTFKLESTDAGKTLRAFGLYDDVRGGKITIYGQPNRGDTKGNLFGRALIQNFSVKHAPALAKLLGAMSMKGVDDLLKNDGIVFSKLAANFEWRFRESGNLLILKKGRTSGSSLGLTFDGIIDQAKNETDISGTIIPFSSVNKVLGEIPLIGEFLTGGKALFAATYKMTGPSDDPIVTVNPLSVLAPGFLRQILFEEDVKKKIKKAE